MTMMNKENGRIANASVRFSGLPGGFLVSNFETADHSRPRLHPGAAIAFAIAAAVAAMLIVEIIFS